MQQCIRTDSYADKVDGCKSCKGFLQISYMFNRIVALEVEPISRNTQRLISRSKISNEIQLHGNQYKLFGIIEYRRVAKHYVAHIYCGKY